MKNIFNSLFLLAAFSLFAVACSEDRDNPTLNPNSSEFVLNVPALAANNTFDLSNCESITLTTSQPDYGFTASTLYTVLISLDGENFVSLPTTFTTAKMPVSAAEINDAILEMAGDTDLSKPIPLFVKLTAHIYGHDELGNAESNIIQIPAVQPYIPEVTIELPKTMHIVGGFPASTVDGNGWSKFIPLHQVFGQEGLFYGVVYLPAGAEFKINPDDGWKGNDKGFGQVTPEDNAEAGLHSNNPDDEKANLQVENAGWYTVIVKTKIANAAVLYTVSLKKAEVYVIGAAADPNDWSMKNEWKFTAPADASGKWISPAFAGSGELRMFIDCDTDWWRTEFTIKADGTLYYRDKDIPANWAENVGPDFSCNVNTGEHAELDFTNEIGEVKK